MESPYLVIGYFVLFLQATSSYNGPIVDLLYT
jgi:hypothetical protein